MNPTLLGFIFVGPMIKKLGVVKTLLVSFAMGAGANILLLFTKDIFFCYALFGSITTFATIPMMCLVGVMTAMSSDYNEYKYEGKDGCIYIGYDTDENRVTYISIWSYK